MMVQGGDLGVPGIGVWAVGQGYERGAGPGAGGVGQGWARARATRAGLAGGKAGALIYRSIYHLYAIK